MKQFWKEMFDLCGVKVAYASKYGCQKTDRRMVGPFLALKQTNDIGINNQMHSILVHQNYTYNIDNNNPHSNSSNNSSDFEIGVPFPGF